MRWWRSPLPARDKSKSSAVKEEIRGGKNIWCIVENKAEGVMKEKKATNGEVYGNLKGWALKNWCFQTVVLEKTLESPLDCKEIKSVNPKGNQPWVFIGRTDTEAPITLATWWEELTHWKRPWCRQGWKQKEKGTTENRMAGWHHWLSGCEFEQTLGDSEG